MDIGELLCIAGALDALYDAPENEAMGYICHVLADRVRCIARDLDARETADASGADLRAGRDRCPGDPIWPLHPEP